MHAINISWYNIRILYYNNCMPSRVSNRPTMFLSNLAYLSINILDYVRQHHHHTDHRFIILYYMMLKLLELATLCLNALLLYCKTFLVSFKHKGCPLKISVKKFGTVITLDIVKAGLHCSFKISRQILPLLLIFG